MWEKFKGAVRGPLAQSASPETVQYHQMYAARWNMRGILLSFNAGLMSWVLFGLVSKGYDVPFWSVTLTLGVAVVALPVYTYWAGAHRGIADQMQYDLARKTGK
jgi:hypothetical protein